MRILLTIIISFLLPLALHAQDWMASPEAAAYYSSNMKQVYTLRGRVFGVDDFEPKPYPLQGANVQLWCLGDSTVKEGQSADNRGGFWLSHNRRDRLKDTRMRVRISYVGMQPFDTIYSLPGKKTSWGGTEFVVNLDSLVLHSNPITTKEAEIVAELKKMYQRGDTIIFNAEAYDMPSGSVLLDLVRRLPGLEYSGGKMSYMGEDINEIRLNGESFFKRDMSIALNNMPHDKLKSLKVYEVPDDTLDVMSDDHLVMDMVTKDPVSNVLFANFNLSTTPKFNHFGFDGDFSNWKSNERGSIYGQFSTGDIPYPGEMVDDKQNTHGYISYDRRFGKLTTRAAYTHSYDRNESSQSSVNQLYMPEYTQNSWNESSNGSKSRNNNADFSLYNNMANDKVFRSWDLGGSFNHSTDESWNQSTDSIANDSMAVSKSRSSNSTHGNDKSFSLNGSYNYGWGKNRKHNLRLQLSMNNNNHESTNRQVQENRFYQLGDSLRQTNHLIASPNKSHSINTGLYYDLQITNQMSLRAAYTFNLSTNSSNQNYSDIQADGTLTTIDSLQYRDKTRQLSHGPEIGFHVYKDRILSNITLSARPTCMKADNAQGRTPADASGEQTWKKREINRYSAVQYNISARGTLYMHERKNQISYTYNGSNQLPSVSNLRTTTDYSDPMHIVMGNKDLHQAFRHSMTLEYQLGSLMRLRGNYGWTDRQQTTLSIIDRQTGVSTTRPMNINGNWNAGGYLFIAKQIHDVSLSLNANYSYSNNMSYVQNQTDNEAHKSRSISQNITTGINSSYGSRYIVASARASYSMNHNKSEYVKNPTRGQQVSGGVELEVSTNIHLEFNTNLAITRQFGYQLASANRTIATWNASLDYKCLKRRLGTLRIEARDILRSQTGFNASMSATGWNESQQSGDTSMFILTFAYRFNDM